jgi:hypothetical protein
MKKILFGILFFFILMAVFAVYSIPVTANNVARRINKTFKAAERAFAKDPSGLEAQQLLNKSRLIIDTIQPYFYGLPGALHEHSPARQMRVEQVEDWLTHYEPFFVKLISTLSDPKTDSSVIVSYVKFAKPSIKIKSALLKVARSETTRPENAAEAYNGLFYLELDDPEIR